MEKIAINIENLSKSYGNTIAVDNISVQVFESECFGFLGPNGAGKTTTMKMIYGKSIPNKCENAKIDVFGYDPLKESIKIKFISGIVPQQDNLDLDLSVEDNLRIYSKFYGIPRKIAENKIQELLLFMELQEKSKSYVRQLSGGMQRRLIIARALLNDPKLLILDEPTTGLDPQVRHLIWNKLRELKLKGTTILLTTHYMDEAFQICDRVVIMDSGKKLLEGNPKQLLRDNIETYVVQIYTNQIRIDTKNQDGIRFEIFEDSLFGYSNDSSKIYEFVETLKSDDYNIRHSNLEDLFLKVTGRNLNELQ